jgi:MFS family permease
MMGGVNSSQAYVQQTELGYAANGEAVVTNTFLQGGITTVYYLGTLVGCFLGRWASDRFGRIKSLALGTVWGILGVSLQCSARNSTWTIVSRLINGVGTRIPNATVPVYGSEVSDYKSRGQFIAMEFTLNIVGVVIAYWLEYGLSYADDGRSQIQW